ncbi:hypothetical protein EBZ35_06620, partial [bacterium]|nr:hypothetical protein [bacterium]
DTDSDGVPNAYDANPTDPTQWTDPSLETIRNELPTANLQLWVVATQSAVVVTGNRVSQWIDWGIKGRHITQAIQTRRPVLKVTDGVMGVQFDGVSNQMVFPSVWGNTPFTLVVVETKRGINTGGLKPGHWLGLTNGANPPFQWGYRANSLGFTLDMGGRGITMNATTFEDVRRIHMLQFSPTQGVMIYLNGALITRNGMITQPLPWGMEGALGANGVTPSTYYEGDIHEVMAWNEVLSTDNRYMVDQALANRWQVMVDTDGDGVINRWDDAPLDPSIGILDSDGDGINNQFDMFRFDPLRVVDLAQWSVSLNRLSDGVKGSLQYWGNAQTGYVVTTNSNEVTRWLDISGRRNHADALTALRRPSYVTGTAGMLRWDALDAMAMNPSMVSGNVSLYVVNQRRSPMVGTLLTVTTSSGVSLNIGFPSSNTLRLSLGTATMEVSSNLIATTSRWALGVHFSQVNGMTVAINGVPMLVSASMTSPLSNATGLQLGNGYTGDIGEVMVWSRDLLPSERFYIEDYLRVQWGITAMDSDGDGSPNAVDPDSLSPWVTDTDTDGDGVPNAIDAYPTDDARVVAVDTIAPALLGVSANVMAQLGAWMVAMPNGVISDASGVSRWLDLSGKKRHFGQLNVASRPRLLTQSGVSTIEFDGVLDGMTADALPLGGSAYTVYIVDRRGNATGTAPLMGDINSGWGIRYSSNGQGMDATHGGAGVVSTVIPAYTPGIMRLIGLKYAGGVLTVSEASKLGASSQSASGINALPTIPTVSLGMASVGGVMRYYKGEMAEVMIFPNALTDSMTYAIEGYLANRWGIPLDSDYDGMPNTWDAFPTDNRKVFSLPLYASQLNSLSTSFKSGLSLLLDGRTEGLFQGMSTTDVKWLDRSEMRRHLTGMGTTQPTFLTGSSNVGVLFGGLNQTMGLNTLYMAGSTLAMTVVTVLTPLDTNAGMAVSWGDLQDSSAGYWGIEWASNQWVLTQRQGAQQGSVSSNIPLATGRPSVVMVRLDGRRASLYVN